MIPLKANALASLPSPPSLPLSDDASTLEQLLSGPFPHGLTPEVPDNGVIRPSYLAVMLLTWIMFGVLGCLNVPMLALWMVLGVFTVVIGFLQVRGDAACCLGRTAGVGER